MKLDGLLYHYILFRRRDIDFFGQISCSEEKFDAGPFSRAGPVNAITWRIFSPVSRDPGIAIPGSRLTGLALLSCNRAKLIFVAFNRHAEISANRVSAANRANPPHVIRPLQN